MARNRITERGVVLQMIAREMTSDGGFTGGCWSSFQDCVATLEFVGDCREIVDGGVVGGNDDGYAVVVYQLGQQFKDLPD